jgi:hypothetical protein
VVIYDWQTGERLMSTAPDGTPSDRQTIGTVTVNRLN